MIQPKPHLFGSGFIFKVNRTKPNRMLFYLAVRMTFTLKTEPNRTANTPTIDRFSSVFFKRNICYETSEDSLLPVHLNVVVKSYEHTRFTSILITLVDFLI